MPRLRYGIIGAGAMAKRHADALKPIPGVELTACMDAVADRSRSFAEAHGVKHAFTDAADVFDACDAVSIVTPDRYHVPLLLEAFAADTHVLCEKPLSLTLAEARRAARAAVEADGRGLIHMVNFSHRSAVFHKARRIIEAGKLGDLRYFRSCYLQQWINASSWGDWHERDRWPWRMSVDAGSGGALGDLGCHILDYLTALVGPVKALQCRFGNYPKLLKDGRRVNAWKGMKLDANESSLLTLELRDGVIGSCDVSRLATGFGNEITAEVFGARGAIRAVQGRHGHALEASLGPDCRAGPPVWKTIDPPATPNNWRAFVRGVKRGEPVEPDVVRGAEVQAYLDAAERSAAADGARVSVKKWL